MAVVVTNIAAPVNARLGSHPKYHPASETEVGALASKRLLVIMTESAGGLTESAPSFVESKYMVSKLEFVFNGYIVENVPDKVLKEILSSDQVKAVYEVCYTVILECYDLFSVFC